MDDIEPTGADPQAPVAPHQTTPGLTFLVGDLIEVTSSGIPYRARVLGPAQRPGNIRVRVVGDDPGTSPWLGRVTTVWTDEGQTAVKLDSEPDDYLDEPVDDWAGGPRFDLKVTHGRRARVWSQAALTEAERRGVRLPVVWEYHYE